ncbi:PAS domain S-box protein [Rhodobacter sp. NSM]|uniref:PAS domain S-box protein n=1 Tax=Rhodobacter sp. NSM TaxID=3457501 RepID=UPI003FD01980
MNDKTHIGASEKAFTRGAADDLFQRTLIQSGAAATWDWNLEDGLIMGDAAFAALCGLSREAAAAGVGSSIFYDLVHPDDRMRVRLAIGGILRGADVFSKEYRIIPSGRPVMWVHARGYCQRDDEGRPRRFGGVIVDITDQKRAEERLRIAEAAGGVGTFEHIEGYATVSVSAQFCALLGLRSADALPVHTLQAAIHPEDASLVDFVPPLGERTTGEVEFRIVRRDDGRVRWLKRRGEHVEDPGEGCRFSGTIYDITDAKRTEERLRRLNDDLEQEISRRTETRNRIWQHSAEILLIAGLDGKIGAVNPAWSTVLGWSEVQTVGRSIKDFVHADDVHVLQEGLASLSRGETIAGVEVRLCTAEGAQRWIDWTAVPSAGMAHAVGRDVSARKKQAEALHLAEEQLRQSQKMEALGQLTGGIAHDFNNMLTVVISGLNIVRRRIAAGRTDEVEPMIDGAVDAAHRAAALVHRLLAFSRRQPLNPEPVSPIALIGTMADILSNTVGENIALSMPQAKTTWPVLCDSHQLENAILNLTINARDAMPDGGTLAIECRNIVIDDKRAAADALTPGEHVCISVSDTGTGMTEDVLAKAFDPFFTTKPAGKGTGLGLSMIYGFARQSGGTAKIETRPGAGTVINIILPRHRGQIDTKPAHSPLAPAAIPHGRTVLVVEDESDLRRLVLDTLADLGIEPLAADDGLSGLEILRSDQSIDLLVTDIGLPRMDGRQMAEAARRIRPDLKVLFMTGYAEELVANEALSDSRTGLITKPFTVDAFCQSVCGLLQTA